MVNGRLEVLCNGEISQGGTGASIEDHSRERTEGMVPEIRTIGVNVVGADNQIRIAAGTGNRIVAGAPTDEVGQVDVTEWYQITITNVDSNHRSECRQGGRLIVTIDARYGGQTSCGTRRNVVHILRG